VHGTVGQQNQDGGSDVAAFAAPAPAAAAARTAAEAEASAWVEAEASAAGSEAEPGLEAGAERAVLGGAVLAEVFPEFATGLPSLFVEGTALLRAEPEAESAGRWCEWVVHGESPSFDGNTLCVSDTSTIYRKLS
jgi:hypothetical protein